MPVIVDEVVISIEAGNQTSGAEATKKSKAEEKQLIIEECVEQVLEILEQQKER